MTQADQIVEAFEARARRREERRDFFRNACGLAAATAVGAIALAGEAEAQSTVSEVDVLNFALNLEYLEAQFYSYAATGAGLPNTLLTGTVGTQGTVITGAVSGSSSTTGVARKVNFQDAGIAAYAREIAGDELAHVTFLRTALGNSAAAMPTINISAASGGAFAAAAAKLGLAGFDPYADDNSFLLGAFIFEDVGVTAYKGAAGALINNKTYLEAAAGILAVEAYHAAIVRTALYARGVATPALRTNADAISNLRDSVDGSTDLDQGISPTTVSGQTVSNIVPLDTNGLAFSRTPAQTLNVVYLTNAAVSSGGFFPNGINNGNASLRTSGAN